MASLVSLDFPDKKLTILSSGDWRGFRSGACAKEPETVEWIRSLPKGSVLWDIGASVGPYTLIASALGHTVYAFEPNGPSYGELCQNIMLNNSPAKPLPVAVGTGLTFGEIAFSTWMPGAGGHGSGAYRLPVFVIGADDLADQLGAPSAVKIDVDGVELGVLESGRELWTEVDSIMVECSSKTAQEAELLLASCGMRRENRWHRSGDDWNYLYVRA